MASEPRRWSETADPAVSSNSSLERVLARARTVWKPLEYSSGYLAILAALEVLIVERLLSFPASPAPVVVGLITFAIYTNDRLVDLSSDGVSNPERAAFVRRYQHVLHVCGATAYGAAVALSILGGPMAFALALIPGIAWVLYAVDWVPAMDLPFQRLKELLVVNSAIVAVAWSLTIVFLPVAFAGVSITPTVWVLFWYLALGTFVCTEISNVRDVESDRESGVATLPVAFGVHRTRHALYGVSLLTAGVLGQAVLSGHLSITGAGALLAGSISLIVLVSRVGRSSREKALSVAGEFTRMPALAVLVVVSL